MSDRPGVDASIQAITRLDLRPAPGSAPAWAMVRSHALMETRLLLRNGEQVLLALVIPLLLLVGVAKAGGVVDLGPGRRIDVLTPGVMALAVMSAAFTSLAIATAYERRYGVLKRLGASPLSRTGLLTGKVVSLLGMEAVQLAAIGGVGLALGWNPEGGLTAALAACVLVLIGTVSFASLGMLMAGTWSAEATLAGANLVYVLLLVVGAVVIPAASYPDPLRAVATSLPSGALAEGLREVLRGEGLVWTRAVALCAWAAIGTALAIRTFKWE
ncbi:MAG: ABC transporter permease [Nocardioidaceae bacterium]|nr:ABC transporter permease [Nocardioidaceae bacterium]